MDASEIDRPQPDGHDSGISRRTMLGAAGAAAASLPLMAQGARAQTAATGPMAKADGLKGPYLDLSTPTGNMQAWARLLGNTDMESTKYGWYSGIVMGVVPGQPVKDLVGFEGFSCAKLLPMTDGSPGYRKVLREIGYYRDLKTGEILDQWANPYTDETVDVVHIANDPFNHKIEQFLPAPPSYGGLNKEAPPKIPLQLDWAVRNDTLNLFSHIHLFYPHALQPEEWPRESPGRMAQVSEMFLYQIGLGDMQNSSLTSVTYNGTWSRVTPWLPWMLMGQAEGHCHYECFMGARDRFEDLPIDPRIVAYTRDNHPEFLEAPGEESWGEPSLSSLENYKRTQTPAPAKET